MAAFAVTIPHFFMYYVKDASTVVEIISVTAVEVFFVLSGFVLGPQIVLCAQRQKLADVADVPRAPVDENDPVLSRGLARDFHDLP